MYVELKERGNNVDIDEEIGPVAFLVQEIAESTDERIR